MRRKDRGRSTRPTPEPWLIPGIQAVSEALKQDRIRILELWVAEEARSVRVEQLAALARARRVAVRERAGAEIEQRLPDTVHQGIVAVAGAYAYADPEAVIGTALGGKGWGLLVAADHITDEGNLGAMIRTLAFFGADGLILPRDRSAGMSPGVLKRSSGGCFHVPVVQVVNLGRTLDLLDQKGFWIVGAAGEAQETIHAFDWKRHLVLVLGSEQKGLSEGVRQRCHALVSIPRKGAMEALNVSVACGVIVSEIVRQRAGEETV